jgi:hypothetical protein
VWNKPAVELQIPWLHGWAESHLRSLAANQGVPYGVCPQLKVPSGKEGNPSLENFASCVRLVGGKRMFPQIEPAWTGCLPAQSGSGRRSACAHQIVGPGQKPPAVSVRSMCPLSKLGR